MRSEAEIRELRDAMRSILKVALHGPNADMGQAMVAQTIIDALDWVRGETVENIDRLFRKITEARKLRDKRERN